MTRGLKMCLRNPQTEPKKPSTGTVLVNFKMPNSQLSINFQDSFPPLHPQNWCLCFLQDRDQFSLASSVRENQKFSTWDTTNCISQHSSRIQDMSSIANAKWSKLRCSNFITIIIRQSEIRQGMESLVLQDSKSKSASIWEASLGGQAADWRVWQFHTWLRVLTLNLHGITCQS